MRWNNDRGAEFVGTFHGCVEVGDLTEPQQDTVAGFDVRISDPSMVVLGLPAVELEYEDTISEEPFVVRPP